MKKYGLIGKTLSHSFSRNYFTDLFVRLGIQDSCVYENFELKRIEDFANLLLSEPRLAGLNVTIPYKEQIIPFLDTIEDGAREIGAVNTVKIHRNDTGEITRLEGYNTDVTGFMKSIKPLLKPIHHSALILGTGGASKAVAYALKKLNIPYQKVSRTEVNDTLNYHELTRETLENFPVIINTTPLGTFPETDSFPPIPYEYLSEHNLLFDLVYNPAETMFMKKGLSQGAMVCNGLEMLKIQADEAWKIWNSPG